MKARTITTVAFTLAGAAIALFFGALWAWAIWGMSSDISAAFIWTIFALVVLSVIGFALAADQQIKESRE